MGKAGVEPNSKKVIVRTRDWSSTIRSYTTSENICTEDGHWFVAERKADDPEYGIHSFQDAITNFQVIIEAIGIVGHKIVKYLAEHSIEKQSIGVNMICAWQINVTFNGQKNVEEVDQLIISAIESALAMKAEISHTETPIPEMHPIDHEMDKLVEAGERP